MTIQWEELQDKTFNLLKTEVTINKMLKNHKTLTSSHKCMLSFNSDL